MMTQLEGLRNAFNRRALSNFFTIARFGPDTLAIFSLLAALAVGLYYWSMWYLSASVLLILMILVFVESFETISLSRAEYRQIVGAKCLVLQTASPESRGIVRLFSSDGYLDAELWSTEFSQDPITAGKVASVTRMNSTILEIARLG
jgi:uncharacterized protein (DUF58 family)